MTCWSRLLSTIALVFFIAACVQPQGADTAPPDIVDTEQTISGTDFGNPEFGGTDFGNPEATPTDPGPGPRPGTPYDQDPAPLRLIIGQLQPVEEERQLIESPVRELPYKDIRPLMQMSLVNIRTEWAEQATKIAVVKVCPAATVTAINSARQELTTRIESDCSFKLAVPTKRAYMLEFRKKTGDLVARLVVKMEHLSKQRAFIRQNEFYVGLPAEKPVDLGRVQIEGLDAIPEHNPEIYTDRDEDGDSDAIDTDDDNDGVLDQMERDCDLNGFIDDNDPGSPCREEDLGGMVPVLRIYPFNGQTGVGLSEQVIVRLGCKYHLGLIDFPSALIIQPKGLAIDVDCTNHQLGADEIACEHGVDPFAAGTEYEVKVDEIDCGTGGKTKAATTSFTAQP